MTPPREKYEWRKKEKRVYLPRTQPELIEISTYSFLTLAGEGNPNSTAFSECISALYSVAYGIKMTAKKKGCEPDGHYDYTVYPLEGIWDINSAAKATYSGSINKDDLIFKLMIRQPEFIEVSYFQQILKSVKSRKPHQLLEKVKLEKITDGKCIQMLHVGSYDDEPRSFKEMEEFALSQGQERLSKVHREIYLSDFRKTPVEKLKTVLRFCLK